jgi:hypothetical protein
MVTQHQQQIPKPLHRKQKFNLIFWQGYFFALGVGGTFLNIYFFLLKYYNGSFSSYLFTVVLINFGLYGFFVGKSAGSVWKLQNKKKESFKKSSFFHAIFLAIPLTLSSSLFFHILSNFPSTTVISLICLTFFIAKGIRSGLS